MTQINQLVRVKETMPMKMQRNIMHNESPSTICLAIFHILEQILILAMSMSLGAPGCLTVYAVRNL